MSESKKSFKVTYYNRNTYSRRVESVEIISAHSIDAAFQRAFSRARCLGLDAEVREA